MPFIILPRQWWGAALPQHVVPLEHPVSIVFLSYTRTRECTNLGACTEEIRLAQERHIGKGAADISYNFMIGGSGQVYEGRGWNAVPKLLGRYQKYSKRSLHIGFIGDYRMSVASDIIFDTLSQLLKFGVRKNFINDRFLEFSPPLHSPPTMDPTNELLTKLT